MKQKGILIFVALLCCSVLVVPQTRSGVMTGKVTDDQSTSLPGVVITIGSPQMLGGEQSSVTNDRGIFRFINLPPGTYWLKAEIEGFRPLEQQDIRIKLGLTTTLNLQLEIGSLNEDVEVIAESPIVDIETNALSQNFDREYLSKLPSSRELDAFLNLTPGVVVDTNMSGSQFADRATLGGGSRENYFSMDGTYVTDPGNGQQMIYWNYDIIDEAQVEATGHDAEYGNAAGAVINVITKSGGNNFSGLLNFYYRDKSFRSDNWTKADMGGPTSAIKKEWEGSFNVGGPIVKDKIWFFLSYGMIPQTSETFGFPEDIQRDRKFGFGKITAQVNSQNRLALLFNYHQDNTNHMFANQFRTPQSTLGSDQWTMTYNLQWDYTVSNNMLAAIRAAYVDRSTTYKSNGPGPAIYDLITGVMSGSSGFNNEQTRDRYQFQGSLSYWLEGFAGGDHDIKLGFEYEKGVSGYNGNMQSDYPGGPSFIYYFGSTPYYAASYDPQHVESANLFKGLAGYLKDTWKMGRFTFNVGLRYNSIKAIIPVQEKVPEPITETSFNNFEPRLGFTYDLSSGGRQMALKFHYGKYYVNSVALGLLNPNSWDYSLDLWTGAGWYRLYTQYAGVAKLDPDLSRPFTHSYILSFEMALTRNLALRINGIHKLYKNFIATIDLAVTEDWYYSIEVENPLDNSTFTYWLLKDDAPDSDPYYTNPEGPFRKYWGLQFILEHSLSNNIQFLLSYTYSSTKGNVGQAVWNSGGTGQAQGMWNNPNTLYNKYRNGALDLDKPHQFKFSGVWYAPWGIILGLNYTGYSGYPYARSFYVDIGQDQYSFQGEFIGDSRTPFLHMFDLRLEKNFPLGNVRPRVFVEVFNLLNASTPTAYGSTIGSSYYDEVTSIVPPRIVRLGVGLSF